MLYASGFNAGSRGSGRVTFPKIWHLPGGTWTRMRLPDSTSLPAQGLCISAPLPFGTLSVSVVGLTWHCMVLNSIPSLHLPDANNTCPMWDHQNCLQTRLNILQGRKYVVRTPALPSMPLLMPLCAWPPHPVISHSSLHSGGHNPEGPILGSPPCLPCMLPLCHCPHWAESQLSGRQWAVGGHQETMRALGTT